MSPPVRVSLMITEEHACPYIPGRVARDRAVWAEGIDPQVYHAFMDAGFRRSGKVIYQPVCSGCRACMSLRVPVAEFVASKSQRRVWRRNQDLIVTHGDPAATDEKYDLYQRYRYEWHATAPGEDDRAGFESFLYESPVDTREFCYRDGDGTLLGVGICDVCVQSLSAVYFYFDPREARRGLGTFSALTEIETARVMGIPFYYLGFWVEACGSMSYKATFRPNELLHPDGEWRRNIGVE